MKNKLFKLSNLIITPILILLLMLIGFKYSLRGNNDEDYKLRSCLNNSNTINKFNEETHNFQICKKVYDKKS